MIADVSDPDSVVGHGSSAACVEARDESRSVWDREGVGGYSAMRTGLCVCFAAQDDYNDHLGEECQKPGQVRGLLSSPQSAPRVFVGGARASPRTRRSVHGSPLPLALR